MPAGVTIGALSWMKEKRFISEEEYEKSTKHIMEKQKPKASGDHHAASSSRAAAPVELPAPAPNRRKIDNDER